MFSVAGCRPCLASFLWVPFRAERRSGTWSDIRCARNVHGARVHHKWLSPPQSSRGVRALFWSSPLPLLFVSVAQRVPLRRSTRAGGWRAHHERARGACSARRGARGAWGVRAPRDLGARGPCSRVRGKQPSWALLRARACSLKKKSCNMSRCGVAGFDMTWAVSSKCPGSVLGGDDDNEPNIANPTHAVPV